MAEVREPSSRYRKIAEELIRTEDAVAHLAGTGVRIAYLASDAAKKSRGRIVYGECERIPAKYRWAVPYDFAITVYEPNAALLGDDQLRTLMLHELMHVGAETDEDGRDRYYVVPHDVEDFSEIIGRYGTGWAR